LAASSAVFVIFFAFLKFRQFQYLNIPGYDNAFYDQALWTTARGHWLETSLYGGPRSILAIHVTFFHLLLTPFYYLWPRPETTALVQSVLFATVPFPIYLTAAKRLGPWPALLLAVSFLTNPLVGHCEMLGYYGTRVFPVPFLAWSLWALSEDRLALHVGLAAAAA
jgi:uncharacterized membrane protein